MSSTRPDSSWQEDKNMAGELEDRELDLEDALEDVRALNSIINKQRERIVQLEKTLGVIWGENRDAQ